ncbi:MAG: hypothetical protein KGJ09_08310, partial [Candidatus Omnitrophica bacterium]|nr:hypothetical protein [Candidatus Omnitrophota bacterium]
LVDQVFGENVLQGHVYIGDFGNHKWGYSQKSLTQFVGQFGIKPIGVKTIGLNIRFSGVKEFHVSAADVDRLIISSFNNKGGCFSSLSFAQVKSKIAEFYRNLEEADK